MARPIPSLPVAGTERPPVVRMTAAASSASPPSTCTRQASPARVTSVTFESNRTSAPRRRASETSPSRTSRARFVAGKSFPVSGSSTSVRPSSSSKKRRCPSSGQLRRMFRIVAGEEAVTYRDGSSSDGRMLHRPPPLMRIFRPPSFVRSSSTTRRPRPAAKIAASNPAAPAPTITIGRSMDVK